MNFSKKIKKYDYGNINIGYYDKIFKKKNGIQSAWHNIKFNYVKDEIKKTNVHLDIGCGPGTFLGQLKNKKTYGIDISKKQIIYAKKKYQNKNKKFKIMEKNKIPFKSKTFDSISLIELIEHLTNNEIKLILLEAHRTLKKNGELLITTPNYFSIWPFLELIVNKFSKLSYEDQHINKFNKFNIKNIFKKKKFKIICIKSFLLFSPFLAFLSFQISLKFIKIDNFFTKIIPGHLLFIKLKKLY